MDEDRRDYQRFEGMFDAQVTRLQDPEHPVSGKLIDLSFTGTSIETEEPVQMGEDVSILLEDTLIQDATYQLGEGRVVHCISTGVGEPSPCKLGIRFTKPAQETIDKLILMLQQRRKREEVRQKKRGKQGRRSTWL